MKYLEDKDVFVAHEDNFLNFLSDECKLRFENPESEKTSQTKEQIKRIILLNRRIHLTNLHMLERHYNGDKALSPRLLKKYEEQYPKFVKYYWELKEKELSL